MAGGFHAGLLKTHVNQFEMTQAVDIRNHLNQPRELVKGKVVTEFWAG